MQNSSFSPVETLHKNVGLAVVICLSVELLFQLLYFLQYPLRVIPSTESEVIRFLMYFVKTTALFMLPVLLAIRTSNSAIKITTISVAGLTWLVYVGGHVWKLIRPADPYENLNF